MKLYEIIKHEQLEDLISLITKISTNNLVFKELDKIIKNQTYYDIKNRVYRILNTSNKKNINEILVTYPIFHQAYTNTDQINTTQINAFDIFIYNNPKNNIDLNGNITIFNTNLTTYKYIDKINVSLIKFKNYVEYINHLMHKYHEIEIIAQIMLIDGSRINIVNTNY